MNNQSISTDSPMRTIYTRPEIRGNLFLALLLGIHLVISLPKSPDCAYAKDQQPETVAVQHKAGC